MFSIPHSLQNCWATLCHFLHYCGFMKMLAASLPMVVLASLITESVLARLGPLIAISNSSLTDSSFKFLFKWQWSSYLLTNKWLNNACTTNFYCINWKGLHYQSAGWTWNIFRDIWFPKYLLWFRIPGSTTFSTYGNGGLDWQWEATITIQLIHLWQLLSLLSNTSEFDIIGLFLGDRLKEKFLNSLFVCVCGWDTEHTFFFFYLESYFFGLKDYWDIRKKLIFFLFIPYVSLRI